MDLTADHDEFKGKAQEVNPHFRFDLHDYDEPEIPISEESGLLEIEPVMIKPDKKVYFDVYVHLAKNKKSVRYLHEGGQLSPDQYNRLEEKHKGVKLYVDPKDEIKLRRFLLEASVEDEMDYPDEELEDIEISEDGELSENKREEKTSTDSNSVDASDIRASSDLKKKAS